MMSSKNKLAVGAVILFAGAATAAFSLHRPTPTPSTLVYLSSASASGKALSSVEVIADTADVEGAFAVFRLVTTNPETGMVMSVRKGLPLANVSWPVSLQLDKTDGSVAATAVFTDPGPTGEVGITTSDG